MVEIKIYPHYLYCIYETPLCFKWLQFFESLKLWTGRKMKIKRTKRIFITSYSRGTSTLIPAVEILKPNNTLIHHWLDKWSNTFSLRTTQTNWPFVIYNIIYTQSGELRLLTCGWNLIFFKKKFIMKGENTLSQLNKACFANKWKFYYGFNSQNLHYLKTISI